MAHDLTTHATWTCGSNMSWSTEVIGSRGDIYTVSYGATPHGIYQYDWDCSCPARKPCKHIKAVQASGARCGWNGTLEVGAEAARRDDGSPCCPDCGGDLTAINVGV